MPTLVNQTNTSSSYPINNAVSTTSSSSALSRTHSTDTANNLGYGIGKLIHHAWQKFCRWWFNPTFESSAQNIKQRIEKIEQSHETIKLINQPENMRDKIYLEGLKKSLPYIEAAVDNICKNPNNPASLKKLNVLAETFAAYIKPTTQELFKDYQKNAFKRIANKVAKLNPSLQQHIEKLLPLVSLLNSLPKALSTSTVSSLESYQLSQATINQNTNAINKSTKKHFLLQQPTTTTTFSYPNPFNLSSLNGNNGFTTGGIAGLDMFGNSLAKGNISGILSLIIGTPDFTPTGAPSGAGIVYVLNAALQWNSFIDISKLNGSNGFAIPGINTNDKLGTFVTAEDIDGDGFDDLAMSAANAVYIIYGHRNPWPAQVNLSLLINNSNTGMVIHGINSIDQLGSTVSIADLNQDNQKDLIIGAKGASVIYIIFQQLRNQVINFDLTILNNSNGVKIQSATTNDLLGSTIEVADLNNDGVNDLVMGAQGALPAGKVYALLVNNNTWNNPINLTNFNNETGILFSGNNSGDKFGFAIKTGDFNNDNQLDIAISAIGVSSNSGSVSIFYGPSQQWPAQLNNSFLNVTTGCLFNGISPGDQLGTALAVLKFNNDSIDDLMISAISVAYPSSQPEVGAVYFIWGQNQGWNTLSFNLGELNGNNGFITYGLGPTNYFGFALAAVDINNDDHPDLAMTALYGTNTLATGGGTVAVLFGEGIVTSHTLPAPAAWFPLNPASNPSSNLSVLPSSLIACPFNQPLQWLFHDFLISQGQKLRLSPVDISVGCGNNYSHPYNNAFFTVTNIYAGSLKKQASNHTFNNIFNFFGADITAGLIEFSQNGSNISPTLNLTATDGVTILSEIQVSINFLGNQSSIFAINNSIPFYIIPNSATPLNLNSLPYSINNITKPEDLVFYGTFSNTSYFVSNTNLSIPITEFTGYQISNNQIYLITTGPILPNLTIIVSSGIGPNIAFPLTAAFFNFNPSVRSSPSLAIILGATAGGLILVGLGAFGLYKADQKHKKKRKEAAETRRRMQNTHSIKTLTEQEKSFNLPFWKPSSTSTIQQTQSDKLENYNQSTSFDQASNNLQPQCDA